MSGMHQRGHRLWEILIDSAPPIFFTATFLRFYIQSAEAFLLISAFLVAYGNTLLGYCIAKTEKNSAINVIVCFIIMAALLNALFSKNNNALDLPQLLSNIGFAWALLYSIFRHKIYFVLILTLTLFFAQRILLGISPAEVFSVSRNFISVITLLGLSLYYISCDRNKIAPQLIIPVSALIVALWGIGRSGIATMAMILLGTILLTNRRLGLVLIAVSLSVGGVLYSKTETAETLEIFYIGFERFERLGTGGQRSEINTEYAEHISTNVHSLLFGAPLKRIDTIVEVDGNPHNSYIRLHTIVGLFGVILIFVTIATSTTILIIEKKYLLAIVLIACVFRSAFDSTAFYGPLDPVIFFCLFYPLQNKFLKF